jgi:hypothetical protein
MKRLISIRRTQDRRAAEAPRPPEDYSMKTLYILVTAVVAATLMIATSHADNRNITFQAKPLLATPSPIEPPYSQFVFHVDTNGDGSADLFITETSNSEDFDMKPSVERCFLSGFLDCQLFISFGISRWDFGNGNFLIGDFIEKHTRFNEEFDHDHNPATDPIFVTSIQAIHTFTGGTWDGEDVTGGKANLIVSSAGFFTGEFFDGHTNGVIKLQKN